SGDIGTPGDAADNSYHVVTSEGLSAAAVLDGFTVTAGNAGAQVVYNPVPGTGHWNELPNGSFELSPPGSTPYDWPVSQNSYGRGQFVTSNAVSWNGAQSAVGVPNFNFTLYGYANISYAIPITPYKDYVLSGFFNTSTFHDGHLYLDLNDIPGE